MKKNFKSVVSVILSVMIIISMVSISFITTNAATTAKIYFDNSSSNWSSVGIWAWIEGGANLTGTSWPGTGMKNEGNNIWSFDLDTSANRVIFNSNVAQGASQTDTIDLTKTSWTTTPLVFDKNGSYKVYNGGSTEPTTMKYYISGEGIDGWNSTHTPMDNKDGYSYYEANQDLARFRIFADASGWNGTQYGYTYIDNDVDKINGIELKKRTTDGDPNCYTEGTSGTYYIIVLHPNSTLNSKSTPVIYASTKLPYDDDDTTPHNVTIKSNIKVTATVDGEDTVLNPDGDSETQSSTTVQASVLTLKASAVDYNFAGWKIDGGATITSGSEDKKTITVKVTDDTTITATAITLTPRLSVNSTVAKNTTATVEPNETFTLNALSKVGDKTQKATKYTVDFYQYTSDIDNATHIGSQITINNVNYDRINSLGRDPEDGEYLIGDEYTASMTYSISNPGTYYFYADIKGYDSNGNLTTGEYALTSLGTSRTKDEVIVTVAEPFNKATAYSSGLWVDVQPSVEDSSIALLKWTNKSGPSGNSGSTYTLYVPGGIDLTTMPIYSAFSTLKINGTTIPQGGTYNFESGKSYTVTGNSTNYTLKVYQSTSDSMFTTTNDNLPTQSYGYEISKVEYTGQFISITASNGKICDNLGIDKIKGRGNSSWEASGKLYGKYAYNIKFDSKVKPLNMKNATKAKSWCLLANNMDESLLRNITTYQTAMLAGLDNVPEYKVADLYNNGEYLGSYLITEKVDVGSSKLVDGETAEDHYDGTGDGKTHSGTLSYKGNSITYQYVDTGNLKDGYTAENLSYLIEFDLQPRAQAENCWFKTPQGQYIAFKAPEDINKTEMEFVIKKWVDAEIAVYNNDYTTMDKLLDLDSFADVYLVQEFTKNLDSGATSYFVYWNGASAESADDVKWEATPIWDYDWALGGYRNTKDVVSGTDSSGAPSATNGWLTKYKKIVQDDYNILSTMNFQAKLANNTTFWNTNVVNAWNSDFYDSINAVFSDNGYIKDIYDANYDSFDMNEKRYGFIASDLTYSWGSVDTGSTLKECYNYLLNWAKNRATWMNSKLGETISVSLSSNNTNVETGKSVTLTANLTRSNSTYPITYKYYVSTDVSKYTLLAETTDTSVTTNAFNTAGTYIYYVEATYSTYTKATSGAVTVTVKTAEPTGTHTVKVWFKSSSAFSYTPSVKLDNGSYKEMSRIKRGQSGSTYIGSTYSGSLDFFWYYADIRIDSSTKHTLTFKTANTSVLATTENSEFSDSEYFFAVDNLMKDTELVDLTGKAEYIRNFHRTATHMVYNPLIDGDSSLGYTFINGKEYALGQIVNEETIKEQSDLQTQAILSRLTTVYALSGSSVGASKAAFTIDSATLAQKCSADMASLSELQMALLDVNLDGKVDIADATLMQKALAQ
ncbi:MAG: CotH kinase family protein [Ruminococcus sp.]|nr:CotH kinase family protein [Ruminococcus sp.]